MNTENKSSVLVIKDRGTGKNQKSTVSECIEPRY